MKSTKHSIEIISAPSILGLKPTGVQYLAERLLACGLSDKLEVNKPVIHVPTINEYYSNKRDQETNCLNTQAIRDFSITLGKAVSGSSSNGYFPLVLGGDCSILIGSMSALKALGTYGLVFLDAHADFYEPEKSISGEVADMDLAIVTGRGPKLLTNINNLHPYLKDEHVIHIGQRDRQETIQYGSQDIKQTAIQCFDLEYIEQHGVDSTITQVLQHISTIGQVDGFWIHFDADVLSDELNPAVDYRLPHGLQFEEVDRILSTLLATEKIVGMSVTIYNPILDPTASIANNITNTLSKAFTGNY